MIFEPTLIILLSGENFFVRLLNIFAHNLDFAKFFKYKAWY